MKVLVTGASGPLGRAVVRAFREEHEVVRFVGPSRVPDAPSTYAVDVADVASFRSIIDAERPDAVVHLAAVTGRAAEADPDRTRVVNVQASSALAAAAAQAGAGSFVFASSAAVYGDRRRRPLSELDDPSPQSEYARSKLLAEQGLRDLAPSGMSLFALRIFNVYGPGLDASLVNRVQRRSPGDPIVLAGPDDFVRDYVHVADVADAMLAAVADLAPGMSVVNVGSGEPTSNRRIIELFGLRPEADFRLDPGRPSHSVADISEARRLLDFAPRSLADAIGEGN